MKDVQCYELFGGTALISHAFLTRNFQFLQHLRMVDGFRYHRPWHINTKINIMGVEKLRRNGNKAKITVTIYRI